MPTPEQRALQLVLRDIHRYWFGDLASPTEANPEKAAIWFRQSDATDAHIRDSYGRYIDQAAAIDWDLDALSREEQVALVILLDQFPRNIYRTSGRAFAHDDKARAIAGRLIAGGLDRFWMHEQFFLPLPLEHSEAIADQDRAVHLYAGMTLDAPPGWEEDRRVGLDFATKHRDIIRSFGRFPHRNAMLGRTSTPEETEFLKGGRGY